MRTKNILISLLLLALPLCAAAAEFKDKGETIAVDFPAGWASSFPSRIPNWATIT